MHVRSKPSARSNYCQFADFQHFGLNQAGRYSNPSAVALSTRSNSAPIAGGPRSAVTRDDPS